MMKIDIITVGKLKEKFFAAACDEYIKRLGRDCELKIIELDEHRLPSAPSEAQISAALEKEAERIREKIRPRSRIIAMCIEGRERSSEEMAKLMEEGAMLGSTGLTFIIGGSFGLSESIKKEAWVKLSMSRMTFPHHLARVMLLEQIYRAFRINSGSDYHK